MHLPAVLAVALLMVSSTVTADPAYWKSEGWKTDFSKTEIAFDEIMSGGPPRDGIPPIDDPQFVAVADAEYAAREPVIAFKVGDDARAYPLSVLIWHEIVNDTVGGMAVAVTYCPCATPPLSLTGRLTEGRCGLARPENCETPT